MSKNDIPFHEVIASFVEGLRMPKELGINGMSYSYGGSNITFETNPTYPIVSVSHLPNLVTSHLLHLQVSSFAGYHLCLWGDSPREEGHLRLAVQDCFGVCCWGFLSLCFSFSLGTRSYSDFTFAAEIVHHCASATDCWHFASNAGSIDIIRCTSLVIKSIVVQLDNGTLLNDEDLPPLPDKM